MSLLAAVLTGYALGSFIERASLAYLACLPAAPFVYLFMSFLFNGFSSQGLQMPSIGVLVIAMLIEVALLILGVFIARRKAARNSYRA